MQVIFHLPNGTSQFWYVVLNWVHMLLTPQHTHTHTHIPHPCTYNTHLLVHTAESVVLWLIGGKSRLTVSLKWAESFSSKARSSLHSICRTRYALYSLSFFTEERSLLILQWNPGQVLKVTDPEHRRSFPDQEPPNTALCSSKVKVCPELGSQEFWVQTFLSKYIWCYPPSYYVGLGWGGLGALYEWNTRSIPSQRVRCWPPSPALCFAYMSSEPVAGADTGASHPRWDVVPSMCSQGNPQDERVGEWEREWDKARG